MCVVGFNRHAAVVVVMRKNGSQHGAMASGQRQREKKHAEEEKLPA